MDVPAIRAAIKDALDTVGNLHVYGYVPDNPNTPFIIVFPERIPFHQTYGDDTTPTFVLLCGAGTTAMQSAQGQMDRWLSTGDGSIADSLDADPTLGGVVDSCQLQQLRSHSAQPLIDGGTRYLLAEFVLEVLA